MLPIRDDNPTRRTAYVTLAIIALNIVAFLVWEPTFASSSQSQVRETAFFYCHAAVPWEITHRTNLASGGAGARVALEREFGPGTGADAQAFMQRQCSNKSWVASIFTAMFLHAGWLHIAGNMLFLWVFGNNVEDRLGRIKYLLFYLAAGVIATVAQVLAGPNLAVPNLGASGAIAGVLGAYIVMFPRRRVLTLVFFIFVTWVYLPAWVVLAAWFVIQLFNGVNALSAHVGVGGGVAFWAHIGGFAFGALLALLLFPKEGLARRPPPVRPDLRRGTWRRRRLPPPTAPPRPDWPAA